MNTSPLPGEAATQPVESIPVARKPRKPDLLILGMRISADSDSGISQLSAGTPSRLLTTIEPRLAWNLSRNRLAWAAEYRPGFSSYHRQFTGNAVSHALETRFEFKPGKRSKVEIQNSFLRTANPFDRLRDPGFISTSPGQADDSLFAPATRTTSARAALDLSYALARHTTVGIAGSFLRVKYIGLADAHRPTLDLEDARSLGGRLFYSHQFTRDQRSGFEYNLQKLTSRAAQSRSLVQSFLYAHTIARGSRHQLSILLGPEHSATEDKLADSNGAAMAFKRVRSNWHWAGTATYDLTGKPASFAASLSHRVSDGGLIGPVRLSGGTAELRYQFTPKWRASLLGSYNRNKTLSVSQSLLSYSTAAVGITRALNENLSCEVRYWRVYQSASNSTTAAYLADHNRISISLLYEYKSHWGK